jgi:aminoglycoside phosphotransferase (APT) family kinase protein
MTEEQPLARGRDGAVYDAGPGLVLRRTFDGRSIEAEARIMRHVAEHGYPVPAVHEVQTGGTEIVMDRVDGPSMMDAMLRRPWTMPALIRTLGDLHERLHRIPAPDWLPPLDDGAAVLHLDLHPMNVLMAERGPVVIDWTNAARGEPLADVANTAALLTCPEFPAPKVVQLLAEPVRKEMARRFTAPYRGPALDRQLVALAELKTLDRNMSPAEVVRLRRLADRVRTRLRGTSATPS